MTRKEAILQAIEILSQNKGNIDIITKLREIEKDLPLAYWTKESIIDAIETYAHEHGNILPETRDLTTGNRLPSNTVIKNLFGINSMSDFFKQYFPDLKQQDKSSSKYRDKGDSYFIDMFTANYNRICRELGVKSINTTIYNKYKDKDSPHISTIISNCGCNSFDDLMVLCGYREARKKLVASVDISYDDSEERQEELSKIMKKPSK